jgi:hypothetical protein
MIQIHVQRVSSSRASAGFRHEYRHNARTPTGSEVRGDWPTPLQSVQRTIASRCDVQLFRLAVRRVVMREVMPYHLTFSSDQRRLAFWAHAFVRQSAGDFGNVNESFAKERVRDFDEADFARAHGHGLNFCLRCHAKCVGSGQYFGSLGRNKRWPSKSASFWPGTPSSMNLSRLTMTR